jgi:ubiquinone biosynthesis protein
MKVISTATNIGQAFKNAGRVREIMGVLVRHGFADLVHRMKLSRFLPGRYTENPAFKELPPAVRLRLSFEELGPAFVKLGQLLATRPDLLPEAFIDEFSKLQDKVTGVPFPEIRKQIETELGETLENIFTEFEEIPLAAASIAQVHGARLKSGEKVAVKVQRPGIDRLIQNDVSIVRGLALLLERYVEESRAFNPVGLVEEFFHTILYELDFIVEANNIRRIRTNMAHFPKVAIPAVYSDFSTHRVLVLERFEGVRFSDRAAILKKGINPMEIVEVGCDAFFHMVMHDGIFHADLHAGNLFVLGDGRIGMIDFGIVGRLSKQVRDSVITLFIALIDEDFETFASEYVNLCPHVEDLDLNQLQKDLMDTISPYIGLSLRDINVGKLLIRSTAIAVHHRLQVPREMMLLFKAIVTIEALGKKLEPNFDILGVGIRLARQVLTTRYSRERLMQDAVLIGRDLQGIAETIPRLLRRFLRVWSQNGFTLESRSRDIADLSHSLRLFTYFFVLSMVSIGLMALGITLLVLHHTPDESSISLGALASIVTALVFWMYALWNMRGRIK